MTDPVPSSTRAAIRRGAVIPASPLALDAERRFDERRQRALLRYYLDAGSGGIAVGMHFTQFEIRRPGIDLYEPVLRVCAEEVDAYVDREGRPVAKFAGINGLLPDALHQAETARRLGFDYAIISMAALGDHLEGEMLHHMRELAKVMPLFAFYLPLVVGGVALPQPFWRKLVEIDNLHGIKIAPFNAYSTLDVVRAVAESGRADEITLYTGNDNSIVHDLDPVYRMGASWVFNDTTLGTIEGLLDGASGTSGRPILTYGQGAEEAASHGRLLGYPVHIVQEMPTWEADDVIGAGFGNWSEAYIVRHVKDVQVL
ncbi:MAG: phage major capsid protein, partial [Hyphomicrobiales bacterium]